jgi:peptidoglycan hydrolase CwlO-like protein
MVSASVAYAVPVSATSTPSVNPSGTTSPKPTKKPPRKPVNKGSEIPVATDAQTKEFRAKLAAKQKRLDEFMAQLDALDKELEIASEQYNAAVVQLEQMKQRVATAEGDLTNAQSAYQMQSDILGKRATSMYKDGSLAAIEVLLDSKSVGDLMARVKFLNTIGMRDADIASSLQAQKDALEAQVGTLSNAKQSAESLEFELKARKIEVMLRIQERQQMLAEAQSDLLVLLDSEASRRSGQESALLSEILSGANKKGIVVQPGSPVETALAYHGVPYLWGGATPRGFDCSGLILYVYKQHGVSLPHYSGAQFQLGEKVSAAALQPGDVVFFGSPIHHVGMYIGGGYFVHAPRTGDFVKISRLADRRDFAGARRYAWTPRTGAPLNAVKNPLSALSSVR